MADDQVMHRQRVLSSLLLALPFILLVHFGSPLHFALLISLAIAVGAWEFSGCARRHGCGPDLLTVAGALGWHAALLWTGGVAGVGPRWRARRSCG
jgi:CDP-diglyceride synthetase